MGEELTLLELQNLEKFQKYHNKKEPKENFKFKSKKKVGEYIDYEEID